MYKNMYICVTRARACYLIFFSSCLANLRSVVGQSVSLFPRRYRARADILSYSGSLYYPLPTYLAVPLFDYFPMKRAYFFDLLLESPSAAALSWADQPRIIANTQPVNTQQDATGWEYDSRSQWNEKAEGRARTIAHRDLPSAPFRPPLA